MIRAAIVGCGGRAHAHALAYDLIPDAKVVGCFAPSSLRRTAFAKLYGLAEYGTLEELIRNEKPDIVHLVTWPDTRVELLAEVSELEVRACTVEKPIALGVQDWRKLRSLAEQTQTKIAVCHQFRWHPDLVRCQHAVQSGSIGDIELLEMTAGMNIAGQGTHTLNYGRSLVGNPRISSVTATAIGWDSSDPGHAAPSSTVALIAFESGLRALWTSGQPSPRCGDMETTWQHVRITAHGNRGHILWEEFGDWEVIASGLDDCRGGYGGMEAHMHNNIVAQAAFHRSVLDWSQGRAPTHGTSLDESLHEWHAILALYASSLENREVELANFDPVDDLVDRIRQRGESS